MAICLEDAVGDQERDAAVANVGRQLASIKQALFEGSLSRDRLPLLFVRVKDVDMLENLAELFLANNSILTGVILPKATSQSLRRALPIVSDIDRQAEAPFYIMPILESVELMLCNDRIEMLRELAAIADPFFDRILNIRVGATDLCGLYGIRRCVDTTIYSIPMVASCIADIVRVFGLGDRYTISGPVCAGTGTSKLGRSGRTHERGLFRSAKRPLRKNLCPSYTVAPRPGQLCYTV